VTTWRFVDSGPGPGPWNLALDEAIFHEVRTGASPPTLRLYGWSAPTLSLGYAQERDRDVDRDACRIRGIEVIRRITGGRAVLHDAEVTYSVSAPAGLQGFGTGLEEAYRQIAAGLVAALHLLGLRAGVPAPGRRDPSRPPRQASCFASVARHEIAVEGRKLIGSAQRREGGAFLQHGSILLESHDELAARVLRGGPAPRGAAAMVGLADLLPRPPSPGTVVAAIVDGCAAAWGASFQPDEISPAEERAARALEAIRYRAEDWNAGRRRRHAG
jgi:lipoate-protein ligase A